METRTSRGKRGPPPSNAPEESPVKGQSRRRTRSTRQRVDQTITTTNHPADTDDITQTARSAAEHADDGTTKEARLTEAKGSLADTAPARRGAPLKGPAPSIAATIPSQHSRHGDESDDDEDEDEEEEDDDEDDDDGDIESVIRPKLSGPQPVAAREEGIGDHGSAGAEAIEDIENARRQVKHHCLIDLALTSNELMRLLRQPDADSLFYDRLLSVKRDTFAAVRKVYELSPARPFADSAWLSDLDVKTPELIRVGSTVVVLSNLATALDWVTRALSRTCDALPLLEALDGIFPKWFTPRGNKQDAQYHKLALDIRTARWIETLAASKSTASVREITAVVFCEPPGSVRDFTADDWTRLFARGPYKDLDGLRSEALTDLCSERVRRILSIRSTIEGSCGDAESWAALRAEFPLEDVLASLREWLLSIYMAFISRFEQTPRDLRVLSQSTTRAGHHADDDGASIVESQAESQHTVVRMIADERSMFNSPFDLSLLHQSTAPPPPEAPEDSDDGAFETDPRFVPASSGKRPAAAAPVASPPPPPKRGRSDAAAASARARMPPPPLPHRPSSTPSSSLPDMADVQRAKAMAAQMARAQNASTQKQRHAWSDRDSRELIRLIEENKAQWADIAKAHDRLERPRDSQAYRDKARNIKVDLLITHSVLPPYFDRVSLGQKEIRKVLKFGANPLRLEADVDDHGRPIRTRLQDAPALQLQDLS